MAEASPELVHRDPRTALDEPAELGGRGTSGLAGRRLRTAGAAGVVARGHHRRLGVRLGCLVIGVRGGRDEGCRHRRSDRRRRLVRRGCLRQRPRARVYWRSCRCLRDGLRGLRAGRVGDVPGARGRGSLVGRRRRARAGGMGRVRVMASAAVPAHRVESAGWAPAREGWSWARTLATVGLDRSADHTPLAFDPPPLTTCCRAAGSTGRGGRPQVAQRRLVDAARRGRSAGGSA